MHTLERTTRWIAVGLALALVAGVAAGCGGSNEVATDEASRGDYGMTGGAPTTDGGAYQESADQAPVAPEEAKSTADGDRMVIRTKTVRLEVESTADTVGQLRALVKTHEGTIQDLQVATDTDEWLYRYDEYGSVAGDGAALRGWVTVRVPAAEFDAFVDKVVGLGTVKYQSEDAEDVTQQHVDLSARLANLRAEEERLRTFFDAAKDVKDMLAVESELNRVRQEIESLDAQVKYLERQAAMATITIELTEPQPVVRPAGDDWGFSDAITSGFRAAADVLTFLIAFIIGSAPLWIAALIALFVVRAVLRRRHRRHLTATESAQPVSDQPDRPQS